MWRGRPRPRNAVAKTHFISLKPRFFIPRSSEYYLLCYPSVNDSSRSSTRRTTRGTLCYLYPRPPHRVGSRLSVLPLPTGAHRRPLPQISSIACPGMRRLPGSSSPKVDEKIAGTFRLRLLKVEWPGKNRLFTRASRERLGWSPYPTTRCGVDATSYRAPVQECWSSASH